MERDGIPGETKNGEILGAIHPQMEEAKNELDGLIQHDINTTEEEKTSLLDMFFTPNLQINASLCVFIWFVSQE